ncbi:MAG: DNA-binding response regulator [Nitrospirae bacterium]|nr:MAG: DNA-binding response regulator [Nitrospirota bacterium]
MNRANILIIEDEKQISQLLSAYLEKEGFTVSTADTGQEAIRLLKERFDLIILDLMLPDIQGEELCQSIREGSDVPILMLTAKSDEEDRIRGLGMGADDYVVKPFSPREVVARVKALLRRTMKKRDVMSFNGKDLLINPSTMEITKGGKILPFTPTEFRIIQTLAERPGQVFTRLQLVNTILGYDFEGYDRTIDAHIKNIRQKIEDNPRSPTYIKTVYGVGYKFTGTPDAH